jgi:integrase
MCRRSELVSLSLEDAIINQENKTFKIKLRKSKTDQYGMGRWLYLSEATQQAILNWINASNISDGMLFRGIKRGNNLSKGLSSAHINRIYKQIASKTNIDSATLGNISGHSMRVGAAQDLLISGASLPVIMQRGRWSKADTMMRYVENISF